MTGLEMGVGVADITPTSAVRLAGFLAREPAVPPLVVADPLQARVVAMRQGGTTALLVVCDLVGMSAAFSAPVRAAVAAATGVPVTQVLTSCTHTHSGPDTLLGMDLHDGYADLLCARVVAAAAEAVATLAPVSVGVAEVDVPLDLAVNRRGFTHTPRLQLVDVQSAGGRVATLVGVGIHPVTHGPDVHVVTADWVGHCRAAVEAALGGTAVVVAGPLGDVNPPGGDGYERSGGGVPLARSVGAAVASLAVTAAGRTEDAGSGLSLDHRTVELPVAAGELPRLVSGGADVVVTELFDWTIGSLRLRSLPGEPLSGFVAALPGSGCTMTVGLAPTWQGYLPHPDLMGGGYEDELGLGAPAMRTLLEALGSGMTTWHGVLEGFYGQPYSDEARLDLVRWVGTVGGRDYVYAPKDDPYQRAQWREPYPQDRLDHFRDLLAAGAEAGVRIGFVISPDWTGGPATRTPWSASCRRSTTSAPAHLGVAFDDVPPGGADLGTTHGAAVAAAVAGLPSDVSWAACPVDYGTAHVTAYLAAFSAALPAPVDLFWTGPAILSPEVPTSLAQQLGQELGRRLVLADNFPVSDGPMSGVLHLGPYPFREATLPAAVGGLLLNLGPAPVASRLPAAAGLRWWADPSQDRIAVWESELAAVPGLTPLARACRSWLTDPGPDPELLGWALAALDGDRRLEEFLAAGCRDGLPAEWAADLEPWLEAWEWHALAIPIALAAYRDDPGPGAAFTVAEVWRRGLAMERQLFGIRYAFYPLTTRVGDAERADPRGMVRGETLLDTLCREALARLMGETP